MDKLLKICRKKIMHLFVNFIASSIVTPRYIRRMIYTMFGMNVHTSNILAGSFFSNTNIEIGEGTFINHHCYFEVREKVTIGNHCSIAPGVMICASTHQVGSDEKRAGTPTGKEVTIEDGCWIGARAIILPGVTIKKGCIVGAGAVVTKDCEPNGLYLGSPAQRIKDL